MLCALIFIQQGSIGLSKCYKTLNVVVCSPFTLYGYNTDVVHSNRKLKMLK